MELTSPPFDFAPRYNIAPSQAAPVVRVGTDGGRRLDALKWGLVPFWAKDPSIGGRTINARSETASTSPAFREAMRARRCLVPASGFYEWQKVEGSTRKQPWYFTPARGELFAFAGLWERGDEAGDTPLLTFTILTTSANSVLGAVHDRMPVIVAEDGWERWLDPTINDAAGVSDLLRPAPDAWIASTRVGTRVNSPAFDDAFCIAPAMGSIPAQDGLFGGPPAVQ